MDLFKLEGTSALIVGAAGDLGRQAALALGRAGAKVVVADQSSASDGLEETARRLRTLGINVSTLTLDITDEPAVTSAVELANQNGNLGVLVNAAGVMVRKPVGETTLAEWQRVLDVNLTGTWLLNRATGAVMTQRGAGSIVNISSVYADRVGPVPESAYYASKAGVANLTRSMASEFGTSGVRVNALALGVFYPTNMTLPLKDQPERLQWFEERTLLKRLGNPEIDLDGPLLLLASPASSYITGQILYVDGGWSAW